MEPISLTTTWVGISAIIIFIIGYTFIILEQNTQMNKAKPALFIGTSIFILSAIYYKLNGLNELIIINSLEEILLEITEIFFFLYVAMIYIQALIERNFFEQIKNKIISKNLSYKMIFWVTGTMAFALSPIADNMTTALVLATILSTIEKNNKKFLIVSAINIVVAANAGGAFSPFGDITTLMPWTSGKGSFTDFLFLFPASLTNWIVTAFLLSLYIPKGKPKSQIDNNTNKYIIKKGGKTIAVLGILTIAISVLLHQFTHFPVCWGMLFGLSLLQIFTYRQKIRKQDAHNVFSSIAKIEHDTLIFFIGILSAVGALHFLGFLDSAVEIYKTTNLTIANIGASLIASVIGNVPVMSAILKADPAMHKDQWMLLTLLIGTGGSLVSFGSAAGIGVMGKFKGVYTFFTHLKMSWTILVGYISSIFVWYFQYEILGIG